jgi:prepilin-type N-terminal cleavage/methylation domain-containing protein
MRTGRARAAGFTLVELLAVIAIILILLTVLLPTIGRFYDMGNSTRCMNNIKQIGVACFLFGSDHDGILPGGTRGNMNGPEPWEKSWMGREVFPNMDPLLPDGTRCDPSWPIMGDNNKGYGTLFPYIRTADMVYRCPALPKGPKLGEGYGSNGYFDFSILHVFVGARISLISEYSELHYLNGVIETKITPLIVEEDAYWWMNRSPNVEPSHGNQDRIGTWHGSKGNYLARDGSAQTCKPGQGETLNPYCNDWYCKSPSGKMISLGNQGNPFPILYKSWNNR